MSRDIADLFKVLAVTLLVFGVSTLIMLYMIYALGQFGGGLPLLNTLQFKTPQGLVPLLGDYQIFATLAAVHVTATGLALLVTSNTIDMALMITSKAMTVIIAALLGFGGGHMVYLKLTANADFNINPLMPALVALLAFLALSSFLSVQNLRQMGKLRFVAAVAGIFIGPILMVWL